MYTFFSIIVFVIIWIIIIKKKYPLFAPGGVFVLAWSVFCVVSVMILGREYTFNFKGIVWIMMAALVYLLPQVYLLPVEEGVEKEENIVVPNIAWWVTSVILALAFSSNIYILFKYGVTFRILFNFSEWLELVHSIAVQHYEGELTYSLIEQILNVFVYVAPLCCGYLMTSAVKVWQKILCIAWFVPPLVSMLIISVKLPFIACILFFIVSFYVSYFAKNRKFIEISPKYWFVICGLGILFFALIFMSFVLRNGEDVNGSLVEALVKKIGIYATGHIQAFDTWIDNVNHDRCGLGIYTFRAIFARLGLVSKEAGVYDFMEDACSNVYTQFRPLIEDFGVIGALMIMNMLGILTVWACKRIVRARDSWGQIMLTFVLSYLMFFFVSLWTYTSFIIAFIFYACFIILCNSNLGKWADSVLESWLMRSRGWIKGLLEKEYGDKPW